MAPGTDEDNVGALAEAVWSEKEIMMVLDDKVPSMVEKYTACAQRQRSHQCDAKQRRRERERNANEANSRSRVPNFTEYGVS